MCIKLSYRWLSYAKRVSHQQKTRTRLSLKNCLTFLCPAHIDNAKKAAYPLFLKFVTDAGNKREMKGKIMSLYKSIILIQRKVKKQLALRSAKVDVLMNYWDKMLGKVQYQVSKKGDYQANELIKQFMMIPKQIVRAAFTQYINQCRAINAIAFLQWRKMYPKKSSYHSIEKLTELVQSRMTHLHSKLLDTSPKYETNRDSTIDQRFLIKYKLFDKKEDLAHHTINSFTQIALPDPFPDDNGWIQGSLDDVGIQKVPTTPEKLIYAQCRYQKSFSPYCLYIPRQEIMFKIMRACVSCK